MLDTGEVLLEDAHRLVERVVVLLRVVDDFEEGLDDPRDLVELFFCEFALLVEILHRFSAVFHIHGDQVLLIAHSGI